MSYRCVIQEEANRQQYFLKVTPLNHDIILNIVIRNNVRLIRDKITFKSCYLLVLLQVILVLSISVLKAGMPQWGTYFSAISRIMYPLISVYIFAGYIKYSFIANEQKFRKLMYFAVTLLFANLILSLIHSNTKCDYPDCLYLRSSDLSLLLLFYGFRLIKNEERAFFERLSKLNLYMFIIIVIHTFIS